MIKTGLKEIGSFFSTLDVVTKVLVTINTLVYLYNIMENKMNAIKGLTIEQILNTGGMSGGTSLTTIITSMFAHYSLSHFLVNMITLLLLSHVLSDTFSPMMYLFTFFFSGMLGNILTYTIEPHVVSLGASGGIYGIIGLLLVASLQHKRYPSLNSLFIWIFSTAILFVVMTFFSDISNNISHIIGFVTGALIALVIPLIKPNRDNPEWWNATYIADFNYDVDRCNSVYTGINFR